MTERTHIRYADGQIDDVAAAIIAQNPRAADYLKQGPVIALIACRKLRSHITFGEMDQLTALVAGGVRLRDLLGTFGAPTALRKIGPDGIRVRHHPAIAALCNLSPSTLAQCIPADSQGVWLDGINAWLKLQPIGGKDQADSGVEWIARRLGEDLSRYEQVGSLIDFMRRGNGVLNVKWSWSSAMRAVQDWHRNLNDARTARALARAGEIAKTFDDVICKSGLPDEAVEDDLTFTVLRTLRRLREEGAIMHHCVASYAGSVKRGACTIVSVARGQVRVATLEINRRGEIAQLKAVCNGAVSSGVRRTCEKYALRHWRASA